MRRAVVLLSGGLDSATTLAIAQAEQFEVYALSFAYGQRHAIEIAAARRLAREMGVKEHRVVEIDLRAFGGSALTSDQIAVPKTPGPTGEIPITYVPARNTIFLSYGLAWAEVLSARDLYLGVNAVDYSGYPDCRPEYIAQFERLANLATKAGVKGTRYQIHAPLISLTKAEIIRKGIDLGVSFQLTHSCYDPTPDGKACGECDSCCIRREGFHKAGVPDPTIYL